MNISHIQQRWGVWGNRTLPLRQKHRSFGLSGPTGISHHSGSAGTWTQITGFKVQRTDQLYYRTLFKRVETGEIMKNNSRFSSCINFIIKFIQKSTSYLGLNTMTKWYPFIPNCLRQLIFSSSWVRTSDLSVNSRALCQLSYRGFRAKALSSIKKMPAVGLEPTTTRLKVLRSTKLS